MHPDQVDVTVDVVARLVATQLPHWSGRPIRRLTSYGTVNALFRLGDDIVLRFPLRPSLDPAFREALLTEQRLARRIREHVPIPVPEPLGLGEPGDGYPGPWTAYRWIDGDTANPENIGDAETFARDLAGFVAALHRIDTEGRTWDGTFRGGPLRLLDEAVRRNLAASAALTDTVQLAEIWQRCLAAPHDTADVWIHADLMPGNLLVRDGRLAAVIDLETVRVGDPAVDLMPAWNLLPARARTVYRQALGVDDATWERGRGWAIVQAIAALPYYIETNPEMARTAERTLRNVCQG